ncbi:MAG: type II secretion system GspH family protein, partial [Lachnospiraceae bacterium]|nr:type II secretion system GspH family protein [Lachnospiraceae bacterium]
MREETKMCDKKRNRGFSLVEVVCAVAILGILSATIGGILVMSTKTYRKGL